MDNMTALVSCFARAYHCRNSNLPVFVDPVAEQMLTAEEYDTISRNMAQGIRYFAPGFKGTAEAIGMHSASQHSAKDTLYVAFIGEECVGFTYIIPKGAFHSFPYLHIIAVKEEYRNKGIGKALLDYSEKIAYEMADRFFLVVGDYNPDAKRFYERNGYQQVGEIPNLYRPGVTEYLMAKDPKK